MPSHNISPVKELIACFHILVLSKCHSEHGSTGISLRSWFHFLWKWSGAGIMAVLILIFWRASIFKRFRNELICSHRQCTRVPFSSHLHQGLLSLIFFIIAALSSVWWHLIVVLIWISLITSNVEPFECVFIYLLTIWMCSLEKCLFTSHCTF